MNLHCAKDPCGPNPFPPGDPYHAEWETATRKAEAALIKHERAYSASRPRNLDDARRVQANVVVQGVIDFRLGVFDIWAERGLTAVSDSRSALNYCAWLERYSEAEGAALASYGRRDRNVNFPVYIDNVSGLLAGRVLHWSEKGRERASATPAQDASNSVLKWQPQPAWKPDRYQIVASYMLECVRTGEPEPTVASIFQPHHRQDFYAWLKGASRPTVERTVRRNCKKLTAH